MEDRTQWGDKSADIFDFIEVLESFGKASSILVYWSMNDEVVTHDAVERWSKFKQVYLPVVKNDDLEIVKFEGVANMKPEPIFGILEPVSEDRVGIEAIDLIIVPGVAFDRQCRRLGRGKGYYDRLLTKSAAVKIGVAFDFQLVDEVPTESFDVSMDMVVTESELIIR